MFECDERHSCYCLFIDSNTVVGKSKGFDGVKEIQNSYITTTAAANIRGRCCSPGKGVF